ncbi:MAG: CocE/NonD family hydrolase [Chloroflexota bacterium]|nr:CocE/NonD family hydrolase [Chloroflexota bacterium]
MSSREASQPRYAVETTFDARIPVRDGIELSANLWLPMPRAGAVETRFPAILEMIPYGKDNWRRNADVGRGEWLAARGFALCRLDVRGTGSSPGVALDEYTADETRDGYDAVEWLAAQPWCNGNVGMWGISYGGFTSIQVAKLRPPHLRAIVPVMATDDRYVDDVHYRGGCVTVSEKSQYAVSQVAMNAMPPDPSFRGQNWKEEWLERLEKTPPWIIGWLRHQHDGPYWRQGSLAPDYDAIEAAIFQIGGWMDSYVDPVLRMQARCSAPTRSLVGNWVHGLPDSAYPGPNLDWLHELVRFFDRWLKGVENGMNEEPAFTWFERQYTPPEAFPAVLNGSWRSAPAFPHPAAVEREWALTPGEVPLVGRLAEATAAAEGGQPTVDRFDHRATVGTRSALSWGAGSPPNGLARDLRPDEALGPTYTSAPLTEGLHILGFPQLVARVEASAPVATLVARLADVAPDGTSEQVAAGVLNLTHRGSHENPVELEPGRAYEIRLPLRASGYRFLPGHRIRLSLASNAWPVLWPSPYPCQLGIHLGGASPARLVLPVVPPAGGKGDVSVPAFKLTPPDVKEFEGGGGITDDPPVWRIVDDVMAGTVSVEVRDAGTTELPDGRSLFASEELTMIASDADPATARLDTTVVYRWRERSFATEIVAIGSIASDVGAFDLDLDLRVTVDGAPFFGREWHERIPRRLV